MVYGTYTKQLGDKRLQMVLIYTVLAMVAYRVMLGIIHSILGGIITLVIVVCALCYLRVYKYDDILKFVKQ